MRTPHVKKTVAMSGAMFIALMGATAPADAQDPNPGKGNHERTDKVEKSAHGTKNATTSHAKATHTKASHTKTSHAGSSSQGTTSSHGGAAHDSSSHGPSAKPAKTTKDAKGGQGGDPAGNNGTVKVDDDPWFGPNGHGGTNPSNGVGNDPHLGCDFQVEWYGFDQGDDIISTVTFEMQSPTKDVVLGGYTPTQVFVGGDAAGGGTDLDGKQTYHLSFDGAPHPKHGYHVKLTINTPGAIGADVKHKVFWVEGCETGGDTGGETGGETGGDTGTTPPEVAGEQGNQSNVHHPQSQPEVLGVQATVKGEQAAANKAAQAAVPTAVNSGLVPVTTAVNDATDEWPLALGALGLCLLGAGALTRRARS